jgi:Domain of unknown function (DUF4389)
MEAQSPPPPPPGTPPPPPPPPPAAPAPSASDYPVTYDVDYPDRPLNRVTTFFRIFTVIPIAIVAATVSGATYHWGHYANDTATTVTTAGGLLFGGPLLMILFREKYPRWWFDWNLNLQRFFMRVHTYAAVMEDTYPSTDEEQYVHLDYVYPDAKNDLNRWLPLVKWFLAIPHYFVLFFMGIGAFFVTIYAWFAILFTGHYPRGAFDFVVGVQRWFNRVGGYAFTLVTDRYPPFSLDP